MGEEKIKIKLRQVLIKMGLDVTPFRLSKLFVPNH